jgi:hypothetical protein
MSCFPRPYGVEGPLGFPLPDAQAWSGREGGNGAAVGSGSAYFFICPGVSGE